jgi:hypothetical protein
MQRTLRRIATLALTGFALTGLATVAAADGDAAASGPYYNETQANRGAMQYRAHCAACHGAELEGVAAPGLAGADLYGAWSTLYDVYEYVSIAMPPSNPGGLGIDAYTEIMAHILAFNGYPVGDEPLPADPEFFKTIVLEPQD